MELEPIYNENIIVGVVYNGTFNWYVTDTEWWFLDQVKWGDSFAQFTQAELPDDYSERFNIAIVNEDTAEKFLENIKEYAVPTTQLKKLLTEVIEIMENQDDLLDLCPVLFVDFDNKQLLSMYPEPASYERFVPEGWQGRYEDFTSKIPSQSRYWIVEGVNYFQNT